MLKNVKKMYAFFIPILKYYFQAMNSSPHIAVLILAAGQSQRMKEHIKQLLPYKKSTLLGEAIHSAKASTASHVYVVLGAYHEEITEKLRLKPELIIYNSKWQQGMGGSIAIGIKHLQSTSIKFDGVLIMLADQPNIDTEYLNQLIHKWWNDSSKIVSTKYANHSGVPAVFGTSFFDELSKLNKDFGAKHLIQQHGDSILTIDANGKELDLDDYQTYQNHVNSI